MSGNGKRYFSERSGAKTRPDVTVAIAVPTITRMAALGCQLLPTERRIITSFCPCEKPWFWREIFMSPRLVIFWKCQGGDSNPYGFLHQILSLARLPIPTPRQYIYYGGFTIKTLSRQGLAINT